MKMKKWDKIIMLILVIISFIPYIFLKTFLIGDVEEKYAYMTIDGEFYKKIPLTAQVNRKEFMIELDEGYNKVVIENESIAIEEADCRDGVCKEFGFISKPGETIVCLPHKLYIVIQGNEQAEIDEEIDIRTY